MSVMPFRSLGRALSPSMPLPMANRPGITSAPPPPAALDLSGKRKVWFLIGRGRIGKTTVGRFIAETIADRGVGYVVAAADPTNRSLRAFVDDVAEPPTTDPSEVRDWLRDFLQYIMESEQNAVVDLGGGNTSLTDLLVDMPDLAEVMSGGDLEPVAVHVIGPDVHDLVPLAATEMAGFRPKATAIVLNQRHGRRDRFDQVRDHPTYKEAIERGAVEIWMPVLNQEAASLCDTRHWHYHKVREVAGPFTAAAVQTWLRLMREGFAPINSWMPGG